MATNPCFRHSKAENLLSDSPIPFKIIEESRDDDDDDENPNPNPPLDYADLINTLPSKSFGPRLLKLYKGFWLPQFILPGAFSMQQNFKSRASDLYLASYPKSGTTWLKALIFATMSRNHYSLDQHPLLTHNPHHCIAYMDMQFAIGRSAKIEAIPSPRILSTHLPYSILPESITSSDCPCRIIYICRDPKDVLVSQWHFINKSIEQADRKAPFGQTFELFCEGVSSFGPVWYHILEYWHESVRRPDKILFLKYEEILQEPVKNLKRLAEFIGFPFSKEEEQRGVVGKIVELCSFEKLKNLEVNKIGTRAVLDVQVSLDAYFRKGMVGDWTNHMNEEMAKRLDGILEEKFGGSGLMIPSSNLE